MCTDQPYCAAPYIRSDEDGDLYCLTRISLTTRCGVRFITGPWIAAEHNDAEGWWDLWSPCDFPSALVQVGIPVQLTHWIMDEVTDGLSVSPHVSLPLDGGLLSVELLPAPDVPDGGRP